MTALTFQPWPKIPRLNREILITEKIDGTNAAVVIVRVSSLADADGVTTLHSSDPIIATIADGQDDSFLVLAQSRTRFVTPGADNYGFAAWVAANAATLVADLGEGTHFGEWWGSGIQRGYGLKGGTKRFSLFNVDRWLPGSLLETEVPTFTTPGLYVVPALYRGPWGVDAIDAIVEDLRLTGSFARIPFNRPEGVVVWHYAARQSYKVLLEGDDRPKGPAAHKADEEVLAAPGITFDEEAAGLLPNVEFVTESGSRYEVDPILKRYRKVVAGDLLPSEVPLTDWTPYVEFMTRTYKSDLGLRREFVEVDPASLKPGEQVWFQEGDSFVRTSPVVEVTR